MYLNKSKWRFVRIMLLAAFSVVILASLENVAESSVTAAAAGRAQTQAQAAGGAEGVGTGGGLRELARHRGEQPQTTATGFPPGTLPGSSFGVDEHGEPLSRVVMSGQPIAPIIGTEMIGSRLDRIASIAGHVGYNLVRVGYSPTVIDTPNTFALMRGNQRVATLYFNHSMTLVTVR